MHACGSLPIAMVLLWAAGAPLLVVGNLYWLTKKQYTDIIIHSQLSNNRWVYDNYFAALFIELENLIDMQELPKDGDGLTKPGRFVYLPFLVLSDQCCISCIFEMIMLNFSVCFELYPWVIFKCPWLLQELKKVLKISRKIF